MTRVSVITLAKDRPDHLVDMARGLARQTERPIELIVAVMQHQPYDLPKMPFQVRQMQVAANAKSFGAVRNAAAMIAGGDILVFLDISCIPGEHLIADYISFASELHGLMVGEVIYLPICTTTRDRQFGKHGSLVESLQDSYQLPFHKLKVCKYDRCNSAINFSIKRKIFQLVNGFDECDNDHDAEVTDFANKLGQYGIPTASIRGGLAYFQRHTNQD